MRKAFVAFCILCLAMLVMAGAPAGEKKEKEVTLKGKICCPKCELMEAKVCGTVIIVTKDKKDIKYYFDTASNKKYHSEICETPKNGTVVATVTEKDKKKIIAVKSVKFE